MRHDFLDRYSRLASPIHRLPASFKLAAALLIIVVTVLWPVTMPGSCVILLVIAGMSRVPVSYLIRRLLWLEPFVLGVAALMLFQPNGTHAFLLVVLKSTLCLFTMIVLSSTTPFAELLHVLQRAKMPALLVTTLALMYRYLFVLVDELERMQRARASRTFVTRRRHLWRILATAVGQLFVRSTERAERIYSAMCARGWR